MRPSQKSGRSRGKGNRPKQQGHSPNRVYESAGPEGKVRGTPQQIIDKYQSLARDAQLSGDRVTAENFLQHSEHYSRILIAAQEAQAERQAQHQQNQQPNQPQAQPAQQPQAEDAAAQTDAPRDERREERPPKRERQPRPQPAPEAEQPPADGLGAIDAAKEEPALVDTPESRSEKPVGRPRRPRPKPKAAEGEAAAVAESPTSSEAAE